MYFCKDVKDAIKGHYCCDIAKNKGSVIMDCQNCPYDMDDDKDVGCVDRLNNDVQYYLKKAEELMKPTSAEQPTLPGIFDEPKKEPSNGREDRSSYYDRKRSKR